MHFARQQPIFENRYDAGRQLAAKPQMPQSPTVGYWWRWEWLWPLGLT